MQFSGGLKYSFKSSKNGGTLEITQKVVEPFKNINWTFLKFPDNLAGGQTNWKASKKLGKLIDNLEILQTIRKIYRLFGIFPNTPEFVQTEKERPKNSRNSCRLTDRPKGFCGVWKFPRKSGNGRFPYRLKSFLTIEKNSQRTWKDYRQSIKFSDNPEFS